MRTTKTLAPRQEELLRFLLSSQVSPTVRTMAEHMRVTTTAVLGHLRALSAKGWLEPRDGRHHAMSVAAVWPHPLTLPALWCPQCRGALVKRRCRRCLVTVAVEASPK